jgi:hypothetical protein
MMEEIVWKTAPDESGHATLPKMDVSSSSEGRLIDLPAERPFSTDRMDSPVLFGISP